jgi:hypothetical protein
MTHLSDATQLRLNRLFAERDRVEASRLLAEDCNKASMHLPSSASTREVERCHFAALKLSRGKLESLVEAIALAQTDYRDLLMAADFGEDASAHWDWLPPTNALTNDD